MLGRCEIGANMSLGMHKRTCIPVLCLAVTLVTGSTLLLSHRSETKLVRTLPASVESRIKSESRRFVFPLSDSQVLELIEKCRLQWPATTSELLHFWRLWAIVDHGGGMRDPLRPGDTLTCGQVKQMFLDDAIFVSANPSAYSWFRKGQTGLLVVQKEGYDAPTGEAHRDELLSTIAESGISLDEPIAALGASYSVRDLLNQSESDYIGNNPVEFSAVAFAYYHLGADGFTNRLGIRINCDALMQSLTASQPGDGLCYGTHRCYAIACILNVNQQESILSSAMRERAQNYVKQSAALMISAQHSDGAWRADWSSGIACNRPAAAGPSWGDDILVTGHHLEWLAICPGDIMSSEQIQHAIAFLAQSLRVSSQPEIRNMYLQWSHAARALLLWRTSCQFNTEIGVD
jgi:hypothetical protein